MLDAQKSNQMERKKEKDKNIFNERDLETVKTRKYVGRNPFQKGFLIFKDPQESCEIEEKVKETRDMKEKVVVKHCKNTKKKNTKTAEDRRRTQNYEGINQH